MELNLSKNKKKLIFPSIAVALLIVLVFCVFNALTFIKAVFQGSAGEIDLSQGAAMKFELQRAIDLGVVPEQ